VVVHVDAEYKATHLYVWKSGVPHHRAFHASWFALFAAYVSTFAAAPLSDILMKESTLALTEQDIEMAKVCWTAFPIVARLVMGVACDVAGPRRAMAILLYLTVPGIIGIMFIQNALGFIVCRTIIACSLAGFVGAQVWCSQMFSKDCVGKANATAAGWGSLGDGFADLFMPLVYNMFLRVTGGVSTRNENLSWRLAFLLPLLLHIIGAKVALSGRDFPTGNIRDLVSLGERKYHGAMTYVAVGVSNVNAWLLTVSHAFSFGVELTLKYKAVSFFQKYYALDVMEVATIASILMFCAKFWRGLGGLLSDKAAARWGLRGRIWQLWFWQTLIGGFCIVMAYGTMTQEAPWPKEKGTLTGFAQIDDKWLPFNSTHADFHNKDYLIQHCGSKAVEVTAAMREMLPREFSYPIAIERVVLSEPPAPYGGGSGCISNQENLAVVCFCLTLLTVCVQMAQGATFGIVPFVQPQAMGTVTGMVSAGGNVGSLITLALYFQGEDAGRIDYGFFSMGVVTIIIAAASTIPIYFPEAGGMLFKKGALGEYDPQLIPPPEKPRPAPERDAFGHIVPVHPKGRFSKEAGQISNDSTTDHYGADDDVSSSDCDSERSVVSAAYSRMSGHRGRPPPLQLPSKRGLPRANSKELLRSESVSEMHSVEEITPAHVKSAVVAWVRAARERDVEKMVSLYDPEIGRMMGFVDNSDAPRRNSSELIHEYFDHFLGDYDAVYPTFPAFDPRDVIFLDGLYAVYSGYYTFAMTKDGQTKDVHAKFTYIYRMTAQGVKIVTHNSGITQKGVVVRGEPTAGQTQALEVDGDMQIITLTDIKAAVVAWVRAATALDVEKMVALYHPEVGRLLGTDEDASAPRRSSLALIRGYYEEFLGENEAVQPVFPAFDPSDVLFICDDHASYSGYYKFAITKDGATKDVFAKFTFIFRMTENGVKIVTHNSGITPKGAVLRT
jgi:nitrate/nitrite transporter NarK